MPPIRNQGQCGSCWSFATVAAIETSQCILGNTGGYTKLSEQNLASCSTRNYGCNGGVPVWAMQYIMENGICTDQEDPYTSTHGALGSGCSASCTKQNPGVKGIGRAEDEAGLLQAVARQPVVVAVVSTEPSWKQYKGGIISACQGTQVDHAVVVVGYDDTTLKIRNSWGTEWGENGYVRLRRSTAGKGTCSVLTDMTWVTY
jgi:C1A family cysteine protease